MIQPFSGKNYIENTDRAGENTTPCVICGKGIKPDVAINWLIVVDGGAAFAKPDDADETDPGYMGAYPIGADCLRKNKKDLSDYVFQEGQTQ